MFEQIKDICRKSLIPCFAVVNKPTNNEFYTDFIDPYATNHVSAGKVAYLTHSGMLTTWDFAPGVAGANADIGHSGIAVGRFMSECDSNGFAKVYLDIASR